jgi:acyl-CoA thioester hydrolase
MPGDGPHELLRAVVAADWIDANGHMNVAHYVAQFDRAVDVLAESVGLDPAYTASSDCALYIAELHVLYRREVRAGAALRIVGQMLGADDKRLHLFLRMDAEGAPAATAEVMGVHVDRARRRGVPFPAALSARIGARIEADRRLPWPAEAGRSVKKIGFRPDAP